MKQTIVLFLITPLLLIGCSGQKKAEEEKALYDQVMDIHDEIMPSISDLHKIKRELERKVENSPNLVEEKRREVESTIILIDSARRSMMTWMHEFNPEDHEGDAYTAYLETEMTRIKKVKDLMLRALEKGKQINQELK